MALRAQLSHLRPALRRVRPQQAGSRPAQALLTVSTHDREQADSPAAERPPQRRVTPALLAELVDGYQAGRTTYKLGRQHALNRNTVAAHLRRAGVTIRMDGMTPAQIEQAAASYRAGRSLAQVGREVGADAETVRKRLRERGIVIRSSQAGRLIQPT